MTSVGSNVQRRESVRKKIERKLAILRKYAVEGVPNEGFCPKSMEQFRVWHDDVLGLERIGSPNTLNKRSSPENAEFIEEIGHLIGRISRLSRRPRTRRLTADERVTKLTGELKEQEAINRGLASGLHSARDELASTKDDLLSIRRKLVAKENDVVRLMKEIQKLKRGSAHASGKPHLQSVKGGK